MFKKILFGIIFSLLTFSVGWGYGIVNNSGTTSEDSISTIILNTTPSGNPAKKLDSLYLTIFKSGTNAVVFRDSAIGVAMTGVDSFVIGGDVVYYFHRAVADIDDAGADGIYCYNFTAVYADSSMRTPTKGTFQVINNELSDALDSAALAAVKAVNCLDSFQSQDGWVAHQSTVDSLQDSVDITIGLVQAEVANIDAWNPITDNDSLIVSKTHLDSVNLDLTDALADDGLIEKIANVLLDSLFKKRVMADTGQDAFVSWLARQIDLTGFVTSTKLMDSMSNRGFAHYDSAAVLGVNAIQISGDATAADNLEADHDGTGYDNIANGEGDWNVGKTGYELSSTGIDAVFEYDTANIAGGVGRVIEVIHVNTDGNGTGGIDEDIATANSVLSGVVTDIGIIDGNVDDIEAEVLNIDAWNPITSGESLLVIANVVRVSDDSMAAVNMESDYDGTGYDNIANGEGDWNVGKTGYSLTTSDWTTDADLPTNFGSLSIDANGIVDADLHLIKTKAFDTTAYHADSTAMAVDVRFLDQGEQSATDLKDFADAGYDPAGDTVHTDIAAGAAADSAAIVNGVLDAPIANHTVAGTFGDIIQDSIKPSLYATQYELATTVTDTTWKSVFVDRDDVAGSFADSAQGWGATAASDFDSTNVARFVWNTPIANHTIANTFGDSLASITGGVFTTAQRDSILDALEDNRIARKIFYYNINDFASTDSAGKAGHYLQIAGDSSGWADSASIARWVWDTDSTGHYTSPNMAFVASNVNVTSISGDTPAADSLEEMLDGGRATLFLSQLNVVADGTKDAITATGSGTGDGLSVNGGTGGQGIYAKGNGTAHGIWTEGGTYGDGIYAKGGSVAGDGISGIAIGGESGMELQGEGAGKDIYLASSGDVSDGTHHVLMSDDSVLIDVSSNVVYADTIANRVLEDSSNYQGTGTGSDTVSIKAMMKKLLDSSGVVMYSKSDSTLLLKQFVVSNSAGDAVQFTSTGSNGDGLQLTANGTGSGLASHGGTSGGHGIYGHSSGVSGGDGAFFYGQATDGNGMRLSRLGGTGHDLYLSGQGYIWNSSSYIPTREDSVIIDVSSGIVYADTIANRVLEDSSAHQGAAAGLDSAEVNEAVKDAIGQGHARTVTLYVKDTANDAMLSSVLMQVKDQAGYEYYYEKTGTAGYVRFTAATGDTLIVYVFAEPAYTFTGESSGKDSIFIGAANYTDTMKVYPLAIGSPSSADLCRLYSHVYKPDGTAQEGVRLVVNLIGQNIEDTCNNTVITNYELFGTYSNSSGYTYIDVIKSKCLLKGDGNTGVEYKVGLDYGEFINWKWKGQVPDQDSLRVTAH